VKNLEKKVQLGNKDKYNAERLEQLSKELADAKQVGGITACGLLLMA